MVGQKAPLYASRSVGLGDHRNIKKNLTAAPELRAGKDRGEMGKRGTCVCVGRGLGLRKRLNGCCTCACIVG